MSLFNFGSKEDVSYSTPQELFDSNKNRKIKSLYDYQSTIIDKYMENIEEKDVVLELPTGERVIIVTGCINVLVSRVSGTLTKYNSCIA